MRKLTFKGGIHPPEKKELSENESIIEFPVRPEISVPLLQQLGAPSKPLVKKGDPVKKGQMIGEAQGFISANVHSPVSGKVKDVDYTNHPVTGRGISVTILTESNNTPTSDDYFKAEDPEKLSPQEIADIAKNSGIVGMGGASFPTHVKLIPPKGKNYESLILNGAECEPYLTADYRLMLEKPEKILLGAKLMMKACLAKKTFIAIESNKPEAVREWEKLTSGEDWIELKVMKTKYPQGAEKQLINAITGKEVPSGGLPVDVGVLVQNVGTAAALYDAVYSGEPLIKRVTTVTGAVKRRANLLVPVGTYVSDIIEFLGGYLGEPGKVIFGGPMMGVSQRTDGVPVIKSTSGILVLSKTESTEKPQTNCIRCSRCVTVCPIGLMPYEIAARSETGDLETAGSVGALDCIECGSCSFICPARRDLVQLIRLAKNKIIAKKKRGAQK
ncbi:electron transport complex subunit RsxC [candidate division WOR-3 bacterium]|nr:electron transport complex subunit RsxC [candidate division WOR-3 bacterium]